MPGGKSQTTNTQSTATNSAYAPTKPGIDSIVGSLTGKIGGSELTGNENAAFGELTANAQAGNPYAGGIGLLANDLLAGGGAKDQTGNVQSYYDSYRGVLDPYANGSHMGPGGNTALNGYLDTIGNDVQNRVNGMFAAGGRARSGANTGTLARGIAEGTAPILAQQYNTDVQRQLEAAGARYGAGNQTAGILSGMGQTDLQNRTAGIDASAAALANRDAAANQMLSIENQKRQLPLQNYGGILNMLAPIGQAFGTQNSNSTSNTEMKEDPLRALIGGGVAGLGLLTGGMGGAGGFGGLGMGNSGLLSGLFGSQQSNPWMVGSTNRIPTAGVNF